MTMKTLQIDFRDASGNRLWDSESPIVDGEVWVGYDRPLQTRNGTTLVTPARAILTRTSTLPVSLDVYPSGDPDIVQAEHVQIVGWRIAYRGYRGQIHEHRNAGTAIQVTTTDPAIVPYSRKAPLLPLDERYRTAGEYVFILASTTATPLRASIGAAPGQPINFRGPQPPKTGAGYAIDNFDIWETT